MHDAREMCFYRCKEHKSQYAMQGEGDPSYISKAKMSASKDAEYTNDSILYTKIFISIRLIFRHLVDIMVYRILCLFCSTL